MKAVTVKTRKTVRLRVLVSGAKCAVKFPRQNVGSVALVVQLPKTVFEKGKAPRTVYTDGKILRQWELVLNGDDLKTVKVV